MPLLRKEEYLATFGTMRQQVVGDEPPPFDFWPYFEDIPPADFEGKDCSGGVVEYVWRMEPGPFEHVLVNSQDPNVFMVLVLDRDANLVHGHRLLDLNREYGLLKSDHLRLDG